MKTTGLQILLRFAACTFWVVMVCAFGGCTSSSPKDAAEIKALYLQLRSDLKSANFEGALTYFTFEYQANKGLSSLTNEFQFVASDTYALNPNAWVLVESDSAHLYPLDGKAKEWDGAGLVAKRVAGKWLFTGEVTFYSD